MVWGQGVWGQLLCLWNLAVVLSTYPMRTYLLSDDLRVCGHAHLLMVWGSVDILTC